MLMWKASSNLRGESQVLSLCISLSNEHSQNMGRGPLKYMGPGPSAPHFENVHCLSWCIHMTILGSLEADLMIFFKLNMLITEISARSSCWTCCFQYSCPSGHARITYSCSDYVLLRIEWADRIADDGLSLHGFLFVRGQLMAIWVRSPRFLRFAMC